MPVSAGASGSAAGGELEEKLDLSKETDAKLQQAEQLAKNDQRQLSEALALLLALEKRCRVGNDNPSLVRVCKKALELCHEAGDHEALRSTLNTLATRRSQKTAAIRALVQTAMKWCVDMGDTTTGVDSIATTAYKPLEVTATGDDKTATAGRDALVVALRDLTDGKIFLEQERAILTRVLACMKESEGDVAAAADVLQEVHVETYGSLSKIAKIDFILEQMRLTLAKQDYVRAAIVANKVSRKQLQEEKKMEPYKVQFFTLLTIQHRHEKNALQLAKDYFEIYSTPSIQEEEDDETQEVQAMVETDKMNWKTALSSSVLFLALSPYSNEQHDLLQRIQNEESIQVHMEQLPACRETVKLLLKQEIIHYPMQHQEELESMPAFVEADLTKHWHDVFHRRIIQHNIRVVSKYYTQIHGTRLAQLLQLDRDRLEQEISDMVSGGPENGGALYAKMDRPKDIVRFAQPTTPESVLTDWATDLDQLLHLLETTTHLIHKENMTSGTGNSTIQ